MTVARTLFQPDQPPWIEHEDQTYVLQPVDPVANGLRPRTTLRRVQRKVDLIPFDPAGATLDKLLKRKGGRS